MERKILAVFQGGYSDEAKISFGTAAFVMKHLDRNRYRPVLCSILPEKWVAHIDDQELPINKEDLSFEMDGKQLRPDAVFMAIHGTPGEDGKLQAYLDVQGIPYNTGNVRNMTLTFNKAATTTALREAGFLVADCILLLPGTDVNEKQILEKVGLPCFVKPSNGGSSLGISKVKEAVELRQAIDRAFAEDDEVMVEGLLEGTEVTCGVLRIDGMVKALPVTEIISKNEFFDYESKYTPGGNEEITPARLAPEDYERCQRISEQIYETLNCRGVVRIDQMVHNGQCFIIEVNTVPGMSAASILPQQAAAAGLSPKDLFNATLEGI